MNQIQSINLHQTNRCNCHCKFCFSSGAKSSSGPELSYEQWSGIIEDLVKNRGITKVNFVGGEPLLYPHLERCLAFTKSLGATTSIVTNATLVDDGFFKRTLGNLDWIGLSIDSTDDYTEVVIGRHVKDCRYLQNVRKVADLAHDYGVRIKLNITVNRLCIRDDFTEIIEDIDPSRLKFIQLTNVKGINDSGYDDLSVTEGTFDRFIRKYSDLLLSNGLRPVFESEKDVSSSYLMMDASGRFRVSTPFGYTFFDYDTFWNTKGLIDTQRYVSRGAVYDWSTGGSS